MAKSQSDIKTFGDLALTIDKADLAEPPVVLISGDDPDLLDMALGRVRARLAKQGEGLELTVFSGEGGDERKLIEQLYNMPLFAPYRVFVVLQAQEVLKPLLSSARKGGYGALPPRTQLLIDYRGKPPVAVERMFGATTLHLAARDVYENRMLETIVGAEKRFGLRLDEDARQLVLESVEKREGAVDRVFTRLRERIPKAKHQSVGLEEVREILLPDVGFHVFELVDALFSRDFATVERELTRFNPHVDNYFAVLKIMLGRADELRRAIVGKHMGMNDAQLAELIGIKNRPPFIQKRILARLAQEEGVYGGGRLLTIYDALIDLQHDFRSRVPLHQQTLVFAERMRETFMDDPAA